MAYTLKANKVALALIGAVLLTACGRQVPTVERGSTGVQASGPISNPVVNEVYQEQQPTAAETDPVEGPVNLPSIPTAPTTPVAPGAMQVRALAMTLTNMPAPGLGQLKTVIIRSRLSWTPVKGAVGYRVYQLAAREGQAANNKGKLVYTTPKWVPFALVGGGFGLTNLNVGQEYVYTIESIDRAGNVIATGQDNCAPLAPLEIPYLKSPAQNESRVGQTPFFEWAPSRGADGFYVEVFSTVRGSIPAVPMWRGFRAGDAINMQYGTQVDVFEGTSPLQWSMPMNVGSRYAWTVCALRTDTHNMQNAKAIAKATSPVNYFLP